MHGKTDLQADCCQEVESSEDSQKKDGGHKIIQTYRRKGGYSWPLSKICAGQPLRWGIPIED